MNFNNYRTLGFTTIQNGLIAYYSQLKLSDAELIIILQLEAFNQRGEKFPTNESIAANTNFNQNEVSNLIQHLIDLDFLQIIQTNDDNGKIADQYSLDPLYDKLDSYLKTHLPTGKMGTKHPKVLNDDLNNDPLNRLSRQFELEFGRYLSPIEREEIASWLNLDHYNPDIIELALREAVLSQAYSLKYIDRILLNWQRHNLTTSEEVKQFLQRNR